MKGTRDSGVKRSEETNTFVSREQSQEKEAGLPRDQGGQKYLICNLIIIFY